MLGYYSLVKKAGKKAVKTNRKNSATSSQRKFGTDSLCFSPLIYSRRLLFDGLIQSVCELCSLG